MQCETYAFFWENCIWISKIQANVSIRFILFNVKMSYFFKKNLEFMLWIFCRKSDILVNHMLLNFLKKKTWRIKHTAFKKQKLEKYSLLV